MWSRLSSYCSASQRSAIGGLPWKCGHFWTSISRGNGAADLPGAPPPATSVPRPSAAAPWMCMVTIERPAHDPACCVPVGCLRSGPPHVCAGRLVPLCVWPPNFSSVPPRRPGFGAGRTVELGSGRFGPHAGPLTGARAPPVLQATSTAAYVSRWSALLAFAPAGAAAASFLGLHMPGATNVDGPAPAVSEVLSDDRYVTPPPLFSHLPA